MDLNTNSDSGSASLILRVGRLGVGGGGRGFHGSALEGGGQVVGDEVEDLVGAHVAQAGGEQHGENLVFADGVVQSGDDVLFVDGAFLEELFHERVVALGDQFDQALVRGLGLLFHVGGDGADLRLAVAAHLVGVGVHLHQVDDAGEALLRADGQLNGNHGAAEGGGERFHHAGEVGALAVHASADDGARHEKFVGIVPDALGDDFDAADRVHHDQRAVHGGQHHLGFVDEHVEAGSVDAG